ncbi:MAG TPA: DUF6352 family protein [Burkholderiales bacterium]|nr:DUF6352 family protein [Burkholderiales bacterium]
MADFWPGCGYRLLRKDADGRLYVTDDYLRLYYSRPELAPPPEAEAAEFALHASLMEAPRREVGAAEVEALADADARENYHVMLRFRARLLDAPTLEAFYAGLFRQDVAVPPDFIHHTVQVILRSLLDGTKDGLEARAAELFFRRQRVAIQDGAIMAADDEIVQVHAETGGFGSLGKLLKEGRMSTRTIELDVLDEKSAASYFERDERHDTVLQLNGEQPGNAAFCRVLERWMAHFHGVRTSVKPVREIPEKDWAWHVGLDAEASAVLNEVYNGADLDEERLKRVVGLFRMDFPDRSVLRADFPGTAVYLGLAVTPEGTLRMKPQNLLVNLPLAPRL